MSSLRDSGEFFTIPHIEYSSGIRKHGCLVVCFSMRYVENIFNSMRWFYSMTWRRKTANSCECTALFQAKGMGSWGTPWWGGNFWIYSYSGKMLIYDLFIGNFGKGYFLIERFCDNIWHAIESWRLLGWILVNRKCSSRWWRHLWRNRILNSYIIQARIYNRQKVKDASLYNIYCYQKNITRIRSKICILLFQEIIMLYFSRINRNKDLYITPIRKAHMFEHTRICRVFL